jgi:hypothetical protein
MPEALLLVFSDPSSPGDEEAFNAWYDNVHIPEVLANVPQIVGAQRYAVAPGTAPESPGRRRYLAVYRIEADDPQAAVATLQERVADGSIGMHPALQIDPPPLSLLYVPLDGEK